MADDEDFERCPYCGTGLEPRVVADDSLAPVEEAILEGTRADSAAMVCPNPSCPGAT